jgi:hypothetical protein
VDANKITDKLTVSIVSVNGIDAKTAGEQGYISISAEDFAREPFVGKQFSWSLGGITIELDTGVSTNLVIPSKIDRWPVTSITSRTPPGAYYYQSTQDYQDNNGKYLTRVTLPANLRYLSSVVPCKDAYEKNGKKAGTYTRSDYRSKNWSYRP